MTYATITVPTRDGRTLRFDLKSRCGPTREEIADGIKGALKMVCPLVDDGLEVQVKVTECWPRAGYHTVTDYIDPDKIGPENVTLEQY